MSTTEKLAEALRALLTYEDDRPQPLPYGTDVYKNAENALAEYDQAPRAPVFDAEGFTQTPWRLSSSDPATIVAGINATVIADTVGYQGPRLANARRIMTCVNACAGIPTAVLEARGVKIKES